MTIYLPNYLKNNIWCVDFTFKMKKIQQHIAINISDQWQVELWSCELHPEASPTAGSLSSGADEGREERSGDRGHEEGSCMST